jgi:hypothetical protein
MAKWRCVGVVTASKYLGEVEADTEEEAKEKAFDLPSMSVALCNQCADEASDASIESVLVSLDN